MPRLLANANQLKALACVFGVLFSEIMTLTVLCSGQRCRATRAEGLAHTTVPAKTPAQQRKRIICQIWTLNPNMAVAIETPANEKTSTGFLPMRSAARPQNIMVHICVSENNDS